MLGRKKILTVICFASLMCCMLLAGLGFGPTLNAQAGCPTVPQWNVNGKADIGFQNGAHTTVYVVGGLQPGTQTINTAMGRWAAIQGSTITFNVQGVDTVPNGNADAANPVVIYEYGAPENFATGGHCAGDYSCTVPPQLDSAGHVTIVVIWVNPSTLTSDQYFQLGMSHEMGHAGYGLLDCTTAGCLTSQTIMASPPSTTVDSGPTQCDQKYIYRDNNGAYGISGLC